MHLRACRFHKPPRPRKQENTSPTSQERGLAGDLESAMIDLLNDDGLAAHSGTYSFVVRLFHERWTPVPSPASTPTTDVRLPFPEKARTLPPSGRASPFEDVLEEDAMRLFLPLVASLLLAAMPLPVQSKTAPVKGAVQGTATVGKGVVRGAGQAGVGVARGTGTVVRSTARGVGCVVTLGTRC
jgi:hypothetical protein